nr:cold-inducible protein YdjO-related protein [Ammoniphilus sp. YIM 78166]
MPEHTQQPSVTETIPTPASEPNAVPTEVWNCESQECKGWMRKNFSLENSPECPLCQTEMKAGTRMIPQLQKEIKKRGINFARRVRH